MTDASAAPRWYPALTVWQPWASLIALGLKPHEYRRYPPPRRVVGKRVAIHAAARLIRLEELRTMIDCILAPELGMPRPGPALDFLEEVWRAMGKAGPHPLPYSAVVCLATIGEPIEPEQASSPGGQAGMWAWPLSDIEALPPPHPHVSGLQGWWRWTDHRT